ncbi:PREDICTED: uncharacterized protein LOC109180384 isoform X2 [Ipomoea nil]|uniref:uncharacterized protein LOC109180384 isoform X2 n=1 Tax=Ipomoea nil TaxID=35883 RepID=UPI00090144DF|nr:PREDICTED: uncharacterized protein LOC109180384 isoform X2 [Ipomoea nil]
MKCKLLDDAQAMIEFMIIIHYDFSAERWISLFLFPRFLMDGYGSEWGWSCKSSHQVTVLHLVLLVGNFCTYWRQWLLTPWIKIYWRLQLNLLQGYDANVDAQVAYDDFVAAGSFAVAREKSH